MTQRSKVLLGLVVLHVGALAALHYPTWGAALGVLVAWGFGWTGAQEPTPTKSARHLDVQDAQKTALGKKLMYREGWIPRNGRLAIGMFVVVSLGTSIGALALLPHEVTPRYAATVVLWTPAVLAGSGFVLGIMLNIWAVMVPLILFAGLGLVAGIASGEPLTIARTIGGILCPVLAIFAVDQLRAARRALDRARQDTRDGE